MTKTRVNSLKRSAAFCLVLLFTLTSIVTPDSLVYAQESLAGNSSVYSFENLPSAIGIIREISPAAANQPFIIHIQDAHANPDAQSKIKNILTWLRQQEKDAQLQVGLEGAAGDIHPEYLEFSKQNSEIADAVVRDLHQKGEITGAELMAWDLYRSGKTGKTRFVGVETPELYRKNLLSYRTLLYRAPEIESMLEPIIKDAEVAKSRFLSAGLKDFFREKERRKEGNFGSINGIEGWAQMDVYFRYLAQKSREVLQIDLNDKIEQLRFPNLTRLLHVDVLQEQIEHETAVAEFRKISADTSAKARTAKDREMAAKLKKLESLSDPRSVMEDLWEFAATHQMDLKASAQFLKLSGVWILRSEIETQALFSEISLIENLLVEKLSRTDKEREIIRTLDALSLLRKLLNLQLTRDEFSEIQQDPAAFIPETIRENLKKHLEKVSDVKINGDFFTDAVNFYETAIERDRALVDNLLQVSSGSDGTKVLITGGFHSRGLMDLMRERGIGYAVIQPAFSVEGVKDLYLKVFKDEHADLSRYFEINPLNKQESLLLKELLEVGLPAVSEKTDVNYTQLAAKASDMINEHPVLSKKVRAEARSGKKSSALKLEFKEDAVSPDIYRSEDAPGAMIQAVTDASITSGNYLRDPVKTEVVSAPADSNIAGAVIRYRQPRGLAVDIRPLQASRRRASRDASAAVLAGGSRFELRNHTDANVQQIRDNTNPQSSEYKGYDIVVIASTVDDESQNVGEQLGGILKDRAQLLSVRVDVFGGEPLIDGLRAFEVANEAARQQFGASLDELWAQGKRILLVPNLGKGERSSPLAQAENNSRGAIRLGGSVRTADDQNVPITLLNLTAAQNSVFATSNDGGYLDIVYASQIYIPSDDVSQKPMTAPFVKFAVDIRKPEDLTDANVKELGMYETDADGNIVRMVPKGTYKTAAEARAWFTEIQAQGHRAGFSGGSHRIRRDFHQKLREYFRGRLMTDKTLKVDPPALISPLMDFADALTAGDWTSVRAILEGMLTTLYSKNKGSVDPALMGRLVNAILPASHAEGTQEEVAAVLTESYASIQETETGKKKKIQDAIALKVMQLKDALGFYDFVGTSLTGGTDPRKWFGLFGMGDNIFWWSSRSPFNIVNQLYFPMLYDLAGQKIQLTGDGQLTSSPLTDRDNHEARVQRDLRFIAFPVMNTTLGDVVVNAEGKYQETPNGEIKQITFDDVRAGITVGGVTIKGSIVLGSHLPKGSTVENSYVEGRTGIVTAKHSVIQQSTGKELSVDRAFVYGVVNAQPLEKTGLSIIDVFRPDISDPRFASGQTRIESGFGVDGKEGGETPLPGNQYSFAQLRDLPNDPASNRWKQVAAVAEINDPRFKRLRAAVANPQGVTNRGAVENDFSRITPNAGLYYVPLMMNALMGQESEGWISQAAAEVLVKFAPRLTAAEKSEIFDFARELVAALTAGREEALKMAIAQKLEAETKLVQQQLPTEEHEKALKRIPKPEDNPAVKDFDNALITFTHLRDVTRSEARAKATFTREQLNNLKSSKNNPTNWVKWYRTLNELAGEDPENTTTVTIRYSTGEELKLFIPIKVYNRFPEETIRYLAAAAFNFAIAYGTTKFGFGSDKPGEWITDQQLARKLNQALKTQYSKVVSSVDPAAPASGLAKYANLGNDVKVVPLTNMPKRKKKSQVSDKAYVASYPGYYAGIDIGGTNVKFHVINSGADVELPKELASIKTVIDRKETPAEFKKRIADHIKKIQEHLGIDSFDAVAMGIPGAIDVDKNTNVTYGSLPEQKKWTKTELKSMSTLAKDISKAISITGKNVPVILRNDMKGIGQAIASRFDVDSPIQHAFVAALGTGLGTEIILDNQVVRGPTELGHMVTRFANSGSLTDTEYMTGTNSILAAAKKAGFKFPAGQEHEVKPLGEALASTDHPQHAIAEKIFDQVADALAENFITIYALLLASGEVLGTEARVKEFYLAGGITQGQTGEILARKISGAITAYGYGDKIAVTAILENQMNVALIGAEGNAILAQRLAQERGLGPNPGFTPGAPAAPVKKGEPVSEIPTDIEYTPEEEAGILEIAKLYSVATEGRDLDNIAIDTIQLIREEILAQQHLSGPLRTMLSNPENADRLRPALYKMFSEKDTLVYSDPHATLEGPIKLAQTVPDAELAVNGDLVDRGPQFDEMIKIGAKLGARRTIGNHDAVSLGAFLGDLSSFGEWLRWQLAYGNEKLVTTTYGLNLDKFKAYADQYYGFLKKDALGTFISDEELIQQLVESGRLERGAKPPKRVATIYAMAALNIHLKARGNLVGLAKIPDGLLALDPTVTESLQRQARDIIKRIRQKDEDTFKDSDLTNGEREILSVYFRISQQEKTIFMELQQGIAMSQELHKARVLLENAKVYDIIEPSDEMIKIDAAFSELDKGWQRHPKALLIHANIPLRIIDGQPVLVDIDGDPLPIPANKTRGQVLLEYWDSIQKRLNKLYAAYIVATAGKSPAEMAVELPGRLQSYLTENEQELLFLNKLAMNLYSPFYLRNGIEDILNIYAPYSPHIRAAAKARAKALRDAGQNEEADKVEVDYEEFDAPVNDALKNAGRYPENYQEILKELIDEMGFDVMLIGHVNTKKGKIESYADGRILRIDPKFTEKGGPKGGDPTTGLGVAVGVGGNGIYGITLTPELDDKGIRKQEDRPNTRYNHNVFKKRGRTRLVPSSKIPAYDAANAKTTLDSRDRDQIPTLYERSRRSITTTPGGRPKAQPGTLGSVSSLDGLIELIEKWYKKNQVLPAALIHYEYDDLHKDHKSTWEYTDAQTIESFVAWVRTIGRGYPDKFSHPMEVKVVVGEGGITVFNVEVAEKLLFSNGIVVKKAPNEDDLNTDEERFYSRLSRLMRDKQLAKIVDIPQSMKDILFDTFHISDESRAELDTKNEKKREPTTFRGQLWVMMQLGMIQFQVDDLSQNDVLIDSATEFNQTNLTPDPMGRLYPRFDRQALGSLAYATVEEVDGKWRILIHVSKSIWQEEMQKNPHFGAQLVAHIMLESFLGAQEQMTKSQFGSIVELFMASPEAKRLGVNDLDLWYIQNANDSSRFGTSYLDRLIQWYNPSLDTSMGGIYRAIRETAEKQKIKLTRARHPDRAKPHFHNQPAVVRNYLTRPVTDDQQRFLQNQWAGKGETHAVPTEVLDWIKMRKFGDVFDNLFGLVASETDVRSGAKIPNTKIILKVDDIEGDPNQLYYRFPEARGREGQLLIFATQPRNQQGLPAGPVEIHMTRALWKTIWLDAMKSPTTHEEAPAFLAQALVYVYMQNFIGSNLKGMDRDSWANLIALHFGTRKAKGKWLNDMRLFMLDDAARTQDIKFFYSILSGYNMTRDVQGNFRRVLFDTMGDLYKSHKQIFVDAITTDVEFVSYYSYLFQEVFAGEPLDKRLPLVAAELEEAAAKNKFVRNILKKAGSPESFLAVNKTIHKRAVYYLQGVAAFIPQFAVETPYEDFRLTDYNRKQIRGTSESLDRALAEFHALERNLKELDEMLKEERTQHGEESDIVVALERSRASILSKMAAEGRSIDRLKEDIIKFWGGPSLEDPLSFPVNQAMALRISDDEAEHLEKLKHKNNSLINQRRQALMRYKEVNEALKNLNPDTDGPRIKELNSQATELRIQITEWGNSIYKLIEEITNIYDRPFAEWLYREVQRVRGNKPELVSVAVLGGPGTGKTTVIQISLQHLAKGFNDYRYERDASGDVGPLGLLVNFMGSDPHLKPSAIRYLRLKSGGRYSIVAGPEIYDDVEMQRLLYALKNAQMALAPKDPHAPDTAAVGTTFDEIGMKERRLVSGATLQALLMDMTVYGFNPQLASLVDIAIPVLFRMDDDGNAEGRLQRRLIRDTLPKEFRGSREDSEAYVLADHADKQIREGLWYEIPMLIELLSKKQEITVWIHDENRLVKLSPLKEATNSRNELRVSQEFPAPQIEETPAEAAIVSAETSNGEFVLSSLNKEPLKTTAELQAEVAGFEPVDTSAYPEVGRALTARQPHGFLRFGAWFGKLPGAIARGVLHTVFASEADNNRPLDAEDLAASVEAYTGLFDNGGKAVIPAQALAALGKEGMAQYFEMILSGYQATGKTPKAPVLYISGPESAEVKNAIYSHPMVKANQALAKIFQFSAETETMTANRHQNDAVSVSLLEGKTEELPANSIPALLIDVKKLADLKPIQKLAYMNNMTLLQLLAADQLKRAPGKVSADRLTDMSELLNKIGVVFKAGLGGIARPEVSSLLDSKVIDFLAARRAEIAA